MKFKSAYILLKPAKAGTGIKAGGALRVVLDMAGIKNIVAKQLGASNKVSNVKAAYNALRALESETQNTKFEKKLKVEKSK